MPCWRGWRCGKGRPRQQRRHKKEAHVATATAPQTIAEPGGAPASRKGSGETRESRRPALGEDGSESGAPGRIRTSDHLIRSQVLYPAELRARRAILNVIAGTECRRKWRAREDSNLRPPDS